MRRFFLFFGFATVLTISSTPSLGQGEPPGSGVVHVAQLAPVTQMVDMHFGALKGVGFLSGVETGGVLTTKMSSNISSGARIELENPKGYSKGQLVVYRSTNGEFYTGVIRAVDEAGVLLEGDVEFPVSQGGLFSNFYNNESHPNSYGFQALADYSLRHLDSRRELVFSWDSSAGFSQARGAKISLLRDVLYSNPGSKDNPSARVILLGKYSRVKTQLTELPAGKYVARFIVGSESGLSDDSVSVVATVLKGMLFVDSTIGSTHLNGGTAQVVEVPFSTTEKTKVSLGLRNAGSYQQSVSVARIEILKVDEKSIDLDTGTHVFLGDSWFAYKSLSDRIAERLPHANVVNKGVGGNNSTQILTRFDEDVLKENPDFVWVMVGTNDIFQGVPVENFDKNIGSLKSKISAIKADGIFFNPSVGPSDSPVKGDLLSLSRTMANKIRYESASSSATSAALE